MPAELDLSILSEFSQPNWNDERIIREAFEGITNAFEGITNANDEESGLAACDRLLYAIGNNRADTYYPIALGILPIVGRILEFGSPWSQFSVLGALIEPCSSFTPEAGQEIYGGKPLAQSIRQGVSDFTPILNSIEGNGCVAAASATELLALLRQ